MDWCFLTWSNIYNTVFDLQSCRDSHFYDLKLFIDFNFWNTNYSLWQLYDVKWNTDDGQVVDIYNDKIFCTDQDVDQLNQNDYYKLNKDQYTFYDGFDNTYTVR